MRIAEIPTRIVQAVVVPPAKLDDALGRPELSGDGLYFLFRESDTGGLPGEAEDCGWRHAAQRPIEMTIARLARYLVLRMVARAHPGIVRSSGSVSMASFRRKLPYRSALTLVPENPPRLAPTSL